MEMDFNSARLSLRHVPLHGCLFLFISPFQIFLNSLIYEYGHNVPKVHTCFYPNGSMLPLLFLLFCPPLPLSLGQFMLK